MDLDQRIEALTQSVELLSSMHQQFEKESREMLARLIGVSEQLGVLIRDHEDRLRRLEGAQ